MPSKQAAIPAPFELGFRMPSEWEPHSATWLAWPHNPEDWPGKFAPIPYVYAEIIRALVPGERVHILVNHAAMRTAARRVLRDCAVPLDNIRFHAWPTDRVWTRDSGSIFVTAKRRLGAISWRFNAWAKYRNWKRDTLVSARMAAHAGAEFWQPVTHSGKRIVLEGGSIDVNGRGTLLTTEECLLSRVQQRNPGLTRAGYERAFHDYLGITNTIWLKRGVAGDDTHGHVDDLARFVAPRKVLLAVESDRKDVNYAPTRENLKFLCRAKDQDGKPLEVVPLPLPRPITFKGQRLPASYANFYIANAAVLVPVFNDPNDRIALNVLAECFPKRAIVPIYCGDFIWGLGAIHCMTQQQPAI